MLDINYSLVESYYDKYDANGTFVSKEEYEWQHPDDGLNKEMWYLTISKNRVRFNTNEEKTASIKNAKSFVFAPDVNEVVVFHIDEITNLYMKLHCEVEDESGKTIYYFRYNSYDEDVNS